MKKIKYVVTTSAAAVALALGFALPAAAQQTTVCTSRNISANLCPNINVDFSRTRTTTLGSGAEIIRNNVWQGQITGASTTQTNFGGAAGIGVGGNGTGLGVGILGRGTGTGTGGAGTGVGVNSQSNTATTTATGTQSNSVNVGPSL